MYERKGVRGKKRKKIEYRKEGTKINIKQQEGSGEWQVIFNHNASTKCEQMVTGISWLVSLLRIKFYP